MHVQVTMRLCHQRYFFPTSRSNQESKGIFFSGKLHTRASTGKPRKPFSLPGLVYHHKKGTWKRKEMDQGRQEGGSGKGKVPVPSTKNSFFWFTGIWVWKQPVSVEVSAHTRLGVQGSHVRRKFWKRTTLHSKSSTLKGLLYAGWRSRCKAFIARKVRTIALEQSVSKKAVNRQATINFYSQVGYPLVIPYLGCTA